MQIRIELSDQGEDEVIIRCKEITPEIVQLQKTLADQSKKTESIVLFQGDTEFYIDINQILFFETENQKVIAHTRTEAYETGRKLYEIEEMLGGSFQRISKSAIVNISKVYSIKRNVASSSEIEFLGTHKQIFVSRSYYKALKDRLEEKRR